MKILLPVVLLAGSAFAADTPPVPKVFKGMHGQKGQYQVEVLEGAGKSAGRKMTLCTDNLMNRQGEGKKGQRSESSCKQRILKDTADEAVIENTCEGRTSTVTIKRESAKSMLMTMESSGAKGPQTMKMRYTHLGACREGQGTMSLDPNSEQCRQMRESAAKMKDRETAARLMAMCK
jgi:hypothetical protein